MYRKIKNLKNKNPIIMEEYNNSCNFSKNEKNSKKEIFIYANKNSDISSLLGLIDGLILRDDNLNILKGLIKQYKDILTEEDIGISFEHACLSHKPEHLKILSNFIENSKIYNDIYNYVKIKDPNCLKYLEPYINKLLIEDKKTDYNHEKNIKQINIFIDNLNLNFNISQEYFNQITKPNILDL
jgi:hypothetical protein